LLLLVVPLLLVCPASGQCYCPSRLPMADREIQGARVHHSRSCRLLLLACPTRGIGVAGVPCWEAVPSSEPLTRGPGVRGRRATTHGVRIAADERTDRIARS